MTKNITKVKVTQQMPVSFKFNKSQKERIAAKGKKIRILEIIVAVLSIAAGVTAIYKIANSIEGFANGEWVHTIFAILGCLVCFALIVIIPVIPIILIQNSASNNKDVITLAAINYAIRGEKIISDIEKEINKELKKKERSKKNVKNKQGNGRGVSVPQSKRR